MKNLVKILLVSSLVGVVFIVLGLGVENAEVIKVGYTAPFTGPAAEFGTNGWRGVQLAVEDVNEKGITLDGKTYKIEIIRYDSICEPTEAVANVRKLILEDEVVAFLGDHCSSCCMAIADLADEYEVPGITIECAAHGVTSPGHPFYFRMRPDMALMWPLIAPRIAKIFEPKKVAYISVNDDYGRSWVTFGEKALAEVGAETVAKQYFERGTTDYTTYLKNIKRANPDMVGYIGVTPEGAMILKQAKEIGLLPDVNFLGAEEMSTFELRDTAGPEVVEGTYSMALWGAAPPKLAQQVQERFDAPLHYAIIFAWDAVHVLTDAIERAQSLDSVKIRDALKAGEYETLEGFTKFKDFEDYKNQGKYVPFLITWADGKRKLVELEG